MTRIGTGAVGSHDRSPRHTESRNEATGRWTWLADDYEAGTAFVTDDPKETQRPIIDGISADAARGIVEDHNKALAAERRATVERIRERFNDLRAQGWTAGGLGLGMKDILDEEAAR